VNDAVVQVLLVGLFALSCGLLTLAWMRRRLALAAAVLLALALGVWVIDFFLIVSGYRGADDFIECGGECSGFHYSVVVGFLAPPLLIALAALAGIVALEERRRARRAR
jgi:formate hydrogenlyase subunit 3/multisubunit Na+/H+ antiporter MnhD subunit